MQQPPLPPPQCIYITSFVYKSGGNAILTNIAEPQFMAHFLKSSCETNILHENVGRMREWAEILLEVVNLRQQRGCPTKNGTYQM